MTGKRFTFLTDPEDFKIFFQSPNVDFQQAVQQAVQKTGIANNCAINKNHLIEYYVQLQTFKSFHNFFTGSILKASFWNYHTELHDTVKHKLAPGLLDPFCRNLCQKFQKEIRTWPEKGKAIQLSQSEVL